MLSDVCISEFKNMTEHYTGIDSIELCLNKKHFENYPYTLSYKYNSRGFRDDEWPDNLKDCIWCIGDSFTVGLGSPIEHTWTNVLQKSIQIRTINVSMNGASNNWIARQAVQILKEVQPKNMIIMWSYFHRREVFTKNLTDLQRRLRFNGYETIEHDIFNFKWCINFVEKHKASSNLIYLTIPKPLQKDTPIDVTVDNFLGEVEILDYARDYHHFDLKTSEMVVEKIIPLLAK
jgi:hypothetical protein